MRKFIKNLFIPHKGNEYKPDILQRISVGFMFGLILLSFVIANLQALLWISSDWLVSAILPAVIVELTNEERVNESLGTLVTNDKLTEAANLKAKDMAKNEYFAHYSPDGISPWYWFDQTSYNFINAGENLAVYFTDTAELVDAWMESPTHRANMMNANYTEIGIGTAKGEYKGFPTIYVVQFFGTPALPPVAVAKVNTPIVLAAEANAPDVITLEKTIIASEEEEAIIAPATFETIVVSEEYATESVDESILADINDVEINNATETPVDAVVVYSDFASTSRDGIPAIVSTPPNDSGFTSVGNLARSSVEPSFWLQIFYSVMALFVFVILLLSIVIEWRRQHPIQIIYGTGLIVVMGLLFYLHTALTSGVTIV